MVIKVSLLSGAIASDGVLSIQSNGTTEAISISTAQVVTLVNNPVITAGTANGVAYLNGSKVVTTGSALTFDGITLGVGVSGSAWDTLKAIDLGSGGAVYGTAGQSGIAANAYYGASGFVYKATNGASVYQLVADSHRWSTAASGAGGSGITFVEGMRLTSTGLGIGTSSPSVKLDVNGSGKFGGSYVSFGDNGYIRTDAANVLRFQPGSGGYEFAAQGNGSVLMSLNNSGNLGLGVTPSAWGTTGARRAIQLGYAGGGAIYTSGAGNTLSGVVHGAYNDATNWLYGATSVAAGRYEITGANAGSTHAWYNAAGGTAGAAVTFTQAMTLDAGGNLQLGTTTSKTTLISGSGNGLTIGGSAAPNLAIWDTTDASYVTFLGQADTTSYLFNNANGALTFGTNGIERARIDSSGNLGIGTTSPNASAILDAQSTTKGVRFPNMTTTQKNAISSPAAGLVVFDTTLAKLCVYSGSAWQTITSI